MRKKISYTVEADVVEKFNILCKEESINKSALIESLILAYINMKGHQKK